MKKTLRLAVLILAIVPVISCCWRPTLTEPEWETYTSEDAGFSILVPGEVEESSELMATDAGMVEMFYFSVDKSYGAFMVSYNYLPFAEDIELSASDIEHFFDESRNGSLQYLPEGKLVYEKKISLDGHPGREFQLKGKNGELDAQYTSRIYLVDGVRYYQVAVASTPTGVTEENLSKFLESFEVK